MKNLMIFLLAASCLNLIAENVLTLQIEPQKTHYEVQAKQSGNYWVIVHTESLIPVGKQHFATLRINDGPMLKRRLLGFNVTISDEKVERVAFQAGKKYSIFFQCDPKAEKVTQIRFELEKPYPVPEPARNYKPKLIPPKIHPRVFVNPEYLAELKKMLVLGDSRPVWEQVKKTAIEPYIFNTPVGQEVSYDANLLAAVEAKAFYYLVTENQKTGREAAELILAYMQVVSLGNGQDISRKVGECIFVTALVYDWCYPLLDLQEKELLRKRMLFYAAEMEGRWPPFRLPASAGHGNETMFSRELLAMAIAVYDEDPLPYQYVAYQMLEIWQPLKAFMHKSGRHSQGSSYGQFRTQYDFLAAVQFKRTFGVNVLPEEIAEFPYYWYYLRLPDGCFLIEGDDNWKVSRPQYIPISPLLLNSLMALYPNPDFKMELKRGEKLSKPMDPVLFLLLNDPNVTAQDLRPKLPLTRQYKAPLPGMAARTGWNFTNDSDDMVLTVNGGNYHLRNHQHGDLGAFQLYYRGYLLNDLGQYHYYGLPYDRMLNKTAALHSMMRFYDPQQKRPPNLKHWLNVGGQNVEDDKPPFTLQELKNDKRYYCGNTPFAGFGPSKQEPLYDFMEMYLDSAYTSRVSKYTRSFVFWNQQSKERPGTLLILDRFTTKRADIVPIFQLTTVQKPEWKEGVLSIRSVQGAKTGCLTVKPLIPEKVDVKILTAEASRTFQGEYIPPRFPNRLEANGSRIELTGSGNVYLNALQIHDGNLNSLPIRCVYAKNRIQVLLSGEKTDYLTVFGELDKLANETFAITVNRNGTHILVLDLVPGKWAAVNGGKKIMLDVTKEESSAYWMLDCGTWEIQPVACKGGK